MEDLSTSDSRSTQLQPSGGPLVEEYLSSALPHGGDLPPAEPGNSHDTFNWDPSLFTNAQIFDSQDADQPSDWDRNANIHPQDSTLSSFVGPHPSYQLNSFSGSSIDERQASSQSGDATRLMSRGEMPRAQYSDASQPMSFEFQRFPYQDQQQITFQSMLYPQHENAAPHPAFHESSNHNTYLTHNVHPVEHQSWQGMEMPTELAGLAEHSAQGHAPPNIDPAFLTASTLHHEGRDAAQNTSSYSQQDENKVYRVGRQQPFHVEPTSSANHQSSLMGVFVPQFPERSAHVAQTAGNAMVPKRPRGRPRKHALPPANSMNAGKAPSDSGSDELQVVEMAEPTPDLLRGPPPEAPEDRVIYDIAVAVWYPRNRPALPEKVRNGIAAFGDIIRKQRDAWKVKNEALKQAELANTTAIPGLKAEVATFRKTMETVCVQALRFGHPSHLAKLGENPFTMSALQSFLVDRINALDMDGSLVVSILKLMRQFTALDAEMLEKTKTTKILTRLTKKAGDEVKRLAQDVISSAASASEKRNAAASKALEHGSSASVQIQDQVLSDGGGGGGSGGGQKRPREVDGGNLPLLKRVAPSKPSRQASKPLALQAAARKRMEVNATTSKTTPSAANGVASVSATTVSKPLAQTTASSRLDASPFSGLLSASKKPGTSNAARAAAAKDKTEDLKRSSPQPPTSNNIASGSEEPIKRAAQSTFSFMDTLADMSRPKRAEAKQVAEMPSETAEEREKRLRKEARRKLRVSWAPEDELVQVKLFIHDPDEELGHADSARRDVDDVGGEGRMLKLHKDMDDLEDDEEGRVVMDELQEYQAPTEIDYTVFEDAVRQTAASSRGGFVEPESEEKEAQEARERTSLMVVHALPSDIPLTPKEPSAVEDDEDDDYSPITSFGEPDERTRQREAKYFEQQRASQQQPVAPGPDISAILNLMKQNPQLSASQQSAYNASVPQQQQQQQLQPPLPQQMPQQTQGVDLSKILAVMSQLQQQPSTEPQSQSQVQNQVSPQFPFFQPQSQQQPTIPSVGQPYGSGGSAQNVNLADLLAQMQGQNLATAAAAGNANPNINMASASGSDQQHRYQQQQHQYHHGGSGGGSGGTRDMKSHPKAKTVICKFWQEGKCKKGDDCTFIHD